MNKKQLDRIQRLGQEELYKAIYVDPLTGVLNRLAFQENVSDHPWVAIVDLDSLKYVNDNLGHRTGDSMLRQLANYLMTAFPAEDAVYRLGGDEFAVLGNSAAELSLGLARITLTFNRFSAGIGRDLERADLDLRVSKHNRVLRGTRSPRGERPPWPCITSTDREQL